MKQTRQQPRWPQQPPGQGTHSRVPGVPALVHAQLRTILAMCCLRRIAGFDTATGF